MKASNLLRLLRQRGCYVLRPGKGSHEIWFSPITGKKFSVPNHGSSEIGPGLEKKIRKVLLGE